MANSYVEYTTAGTGTNGLGQTTFVAPTKFLSINDIRAKGYNGSTWTELTISSRGTNTVTLSATPTAGSYSKVRIYRATTSDQLIDFQAGARLAESDLDTAYNQGLYVAQEVSEDAGAIGTLTTGLSGITLGGTTSVDNLTATGTVTIPSSTNLSVNNLSASGTVSFTPTYATGTNSATISVNNYVAVMHNAVSVPAKSLMFVQFDWAASANQSQSDAVYGLWLRDDGDNSVIYAAQQCVDAYPRAGYGNLRGSLSCYFPTAKTVEIAGQPYASGGFNNVVLTTSYQIVSF